MHEDHHALDVLFRNSIRGVPHELIHYLYFPSEATAKQMLSRIQTLGYTTEDYPATEQKLVGAKDGKVDIGRPESSERMEN
jgi:hypothetical protein